jgi:hypothetical protein
MRCVVAASCKAAYARAGEHVRDGAGRLREVFDVDADGTLTEQARRRFAAA